jgi:hypothetical protein
LIGFSRIELQLKRSRYLPPLCLLLLLLAQWALWLMLVDPVARMLAMPSLLLAMVLLCWPLLFPHPDDAIATLVWEPDLREMWLATAAGQACQVERICFSCSLPGVLQVIKLQRRDRALPTWLLLTPECISRTEARRLHVALRWAPPPESHQATEN